MVCLYDQRTKRISRIENIRNLVEESNVQLQENQSKPLSRGRPLTMASVGKKLDKSVKSEGFSRIIKKVTLKRSFWGFMTSKCRTSVILVILIHTCTFQFSNSLPDIMCRYH